MQKHVVFLHPDLGLGGAERLIVDAAMALKTKGCKVTMYTSFYDPNRCFSETKQFKVIVAGDFIRRKLLSKCHILFATLRSVWLSLYVSFAASRREAFICDQISAYVLILKLFTTTPVIFYCHHPDMLLTNRRSSFLKQLYRFPFDVFEQFTTGLADIVLVNSEYTRVVYNETFTFLAKLSKQPDILYPACRMQPIQTTLPAGENHSPGDEHIFLSINRFERKKNIMLAIEAFAKMRKNMDAPTIEQKKPRLVLAGGYDLKVSENVEYYQELLERAQSHGLLVHSPLPIHADAGWNAPEAEAHVRFVPSFTDAQKVDLLQSCVAVLYTPHNEHFGIVPLECMAARRPVVAVRSGGPKETVEHGVTGFLCAPGDGDQEMLTTAFSEAMQKLLFGFPELSRTMGDAGRERVTKLFSMSAFENALSGYVSSAKAAKYSFMLILLRLVVLAAVAAIVMLSMTWFDMSFLNVCIWIFLPLFVAMTALTLKPKILLCGCRETQQKGKTS